MKPSAAMSLILADPESTAVCARARPDFETENAIAVSAVERTKSRLVIIWKCSVAAIERVGFRPPLVFKTSAKIKRRPRAGQVDAGARATHLSGGRASYVELQVWAGSGCRPNGGTGPDSGRTGPPGKAWCPPEAGISLLVEMATEHREGGVTDIAILDLTVLTCLGG